MPPGEVPSQLPLVRDWLMPGSMGDDLPSSPLLPIATSLSAPFAEPLGSGTSAGSHPSRPYEPTTFERIHYQAAHACLATAVLGAEHFCRAHGQYV